MPGDEHHETRVQENTLVVCWNGEPTEARLNAMVEQRQSLWNAHRRGVYLLTVIYAKTGFPDSNARKAMVAQFESMRDRLRASAIVLEKDGVDATLSRAIISTLLTMSRRPFAMKIFPRRAVATQWLAALGAPSSRTLELAIDESLATLHARSGSGKP